MMVPDELSLHLDQLHVGIIQLTDNFWTPVAGKAGQFFGQVDLVGIHKSLVCEGTSDEPNSCRGKGTLRGSGGFNRLHVDGVFRLVKRSHYFDIPPGKSS